ncbi:MAG: hypothetical protein IKV24_03590 [Bacteroidaceae bacterium]|nr:hypothetical protein [Bacteroidaceae bacterium]
MKAKNWVLALIMALTSTVYAASQEGQSTVEGVPVVDEIVDTGDADTEPVNSSAKLGTWYITSSTDSVSGTIELSEDLFEEVFDDMPDFVKGLIGLTGVGFATGTLFVVLAVLLCIFGLPLLLIIGLLYLIFRKRKEPTTTYQPTEETTTSSTDRTLFNKGIKNVCLGIGLAICLGIWMGDFGVGVGVLITCIGVGELLIDHFSRKQ